MTENPQQGGAERQLTDTHEAVRGTAFRVLLLRGILALVLGILLFVAPAVSAAIVGTFIAVALGVWLLLDGFGSISISLRKRRHGSSSWGWTLAAGIIAILASIAIIVFPLSFAAVGSLLVLWMLAIGLVFQGIVMFADARLGGWGIALGIINVVFGILMGALLLTNPAASLVALIWIAAIYGIVFGIGSILMAFRVRKA